MADPISLRVDDDTRTALEITAGHLDATVSDVLRLAVDLVVHMSDAELAELMKCPTCKGSGRRQLRTKPEGSGR